jgi:heme exporter protein B
MWQALRKRTIAIPTPRVESGFAAYVAQVVAVVTKDVRAELRTKEVISGTLVFAFLVLVIFNFAFDLRGETRSMAAPGMLWVAITLAAMTGLGHVFANEKHQGALEGLLLCPVDRSAIFLGKLAGSLLLTVAMELALLPLFAVFTNVSVFLPGLLLMVVLGTVGFVTVGTLFSAMAMQTKTRELMLPLLLLPVALPVVIAAIEGTRVAFDGGPWGDMVPWITVLVAFDVIFLALCPWLFEYVVEEMGP